MARKTYQRWADQLQHISDTLVQQVEAGQAPWQKTWNAGEYMLPTNLSTERVYRGYNTVWLAAAAAADGYVDMRWGTFLQIKKAGGSVRKGEKGTLINAVFAVDPDKRDERKEEWERRVRPEMPERRRYTRAVKVYTVFNAEQADGLPERPILRPSWDVVAEVETIVKLCGVGIHHSEGHTPGYYPGTDRIVMPAKGQFETQEAYYSALLHELAHASGHTSRLNRATLTVDRTSAEYAQEELRAEIASMMMCSRLGLGHFPQNGVAYIASWARALRNDPAEIRRATQEAAKMSTYVMRGMGKRKEPDLPWQSPGQSRTAPRQAAALGIQTLHGARDLSLSR